MNGCVIPGTPIAVDTWKIRECSGAKLFFLTHLHGDHIVGLTSSWDRPLYCSHITAEILKKRYQIKPEYVNSLHGNDSHLICVDQSEECQEFVSVTLIDAKHCPGAVMFLFEGSFGKILHTGDFRYDDNMMDGELKRHLGTIDVLYLDNTYCDPDCVFPSRNEAMQEILDIVNRHKDHDIIFGIRNLGKEDLLVKIAVETDEWISVPGNILEVAETLNLRQVFLTLDDPTPHRLRVVSFSSVSSRNVAKWTSKKPTIVILPTALYVGINGKPYVNNENVFVVPYSDHSSYLELVKFVSQIQPKRIIPIVRANARGPFGIDISSRADMSCFDKFLSKGDYSIEHIHKKRKLDSGKAVNIINVQDVPEKMLKMKDIQVTKKKARRKLFKRKSIKSKAKGVQFDSNSESANREPAETSVNSDSDISEKSEDNLQNSEDSAVPEKQIFVKENSNICENKNINNTEIEKWELSLNEPNEYSDKSNLKSTNSDCYNSSGVTLSEMKSEVLKSKNREYIVNKKSDQTPSKCKDNTDFTTNANDSILTNPLVDNLSTSKRPSLQKTADNKENIEEECLEANISIIHPESQCLSSVHPELVGHEYNSQGILRDTLSHSEKMTELRKIFKNQSYQVEADGSARDSNTTITVSDETLKVNSQRHKTEDPIQPEIVPDNVHVSETGSFEDVKPLTENYTDLMKSIDPEISNSESEKEKTATNLEADRINNISGDDSEKSLGDERKKTSVIDPEKCPRNSMDVSSMSSVPVPKTFIKSTSCDTVLNKDETYRNSFGPKFQTHDSESHQLPTEKIVLSVKKYSKAKSRRHQQQQFYKCLENCLQRAEEYAYATTSSE